MIIADTDFLSIFLKIERLSLIFTALEINELIITGAVLQEIKPAPVYGLFLEASKKHKIIVMNSKEKEVLDFWLGELESIALAKETNSILLMDDRRAARLAESKGVIVMSVPIFLLHCRINNILSRDEMKQIIKTMEEKDHYQLNSEIENKLVE